MSQKLSRELQNLNISSDGEHPNDSPYGSVLVSVPLTPARSVRRSARKAQFASCPPQRISENRERVEEGTSNVHQDPVSRVLFSGGNADLTTGVTCRNGDCLKKQVKELEWNHSKALLLLDKYKTLQAEQDELTKTYKCMIQMQSEYILQLRDHIESRHLAENNLIQDRVQNETLRGELEMRMWKVIRELEKKLEKAIDGKHPNISSKMKA